MKLNNGFTCPVEVENELNEALPVITHDEGNQNIQSRNIKKGRLYVGIEAGANKWIKMACSLAVDSVKNGGGPFGSVVVQIDDETNRIIRYWAGNNQVTGLNDPTAHGEIMAIRSAGKSLGVFNLGVINKNESLLPQPGPVSHCEIYSSCEPCPMCYSAICWARIPAIYFAATRFDAAREGVGFSDLEIYNELSLDYSQRQRTVYQCSAENSLAAFDLWEKIPKIHY